MTIRELIAAMKALWPARFEDDPKAAILTSTYDAVLGKLEGPRLHAAWLALMRTWRKASPPLPADILEAATKPPQSHGERTQLDAFHQTIAEQEMTVEGSDLVARFRSGSAQAWAELRALSGHPVPGGTRRA